MATGLAMGGLIRVFVQARMDSERFPGKVLASFRGEPLIRHVLRAAADVVGEQNVVVCTSTDSSDDPLVAYLESIGVATFRGPLDDVFERFRLCLQVFPCEWVLRITADSPVLDRELLRRVVDAAAPDVDIVATVAPQGHNASLIRSDMLLTVDPNELRASDREHIVTFFAQPSVPCRFRWVMSALGSGNNPSFAVDTIKDLRRIEAML